MNLNTQKLRWLKAMKIAVAVLSIGIIAVSCQDSPGTSAIGDLDQVTSFPSIAAPGSNATTTGSTTLLQDTFDIPNTGNINASLSERQDGSMAPVAYAIGGVNYYGGNRSITDGELVLRGNYVQAISPKKNINGSEIATDGGFTVCIDAASTGYNTAPNPDPNAIRFGISLGHESASDAVAGYDGTNNDGYLRLAGRVGTGYFAGGTGTYTPFTFDTETALGKVYHVSLSIATDGIAAGNTYTATIYINGDEQAVFTSSWDSNNNFIGIHSIDGQWNYDNLKIATGVSAGCELTTTPADAEPPVIDFGNYTSTVWPPNHKMHLVASGISATDESAVSSFEVTVSSNEKANGKGDGNTDSDWQVVANADGTYDVYVRAERGGKGRGRVYTISATATDEFGNTASKSIEVAVTHDQSKNSKK